MGKIIPLVLALVGLGAGVGAGIALRPGPEEPVAELANPCGDPPAATEEAAAEEVPGKTDVPSEFVKLSNQFVIPLIDEGEVAAMVVMSLTLEVGMGNLQSVHSREPKLRDRFLRVLLDHANAGGFVGAFTSNTSMENLHRALLESGRDALGDALIDVLILDINRQSI